MNNNPYQGSQSIHIKPISREIEELASININPYQPISQKPMFQVQPISYINTIYVLILIWVLKCVRF